MKAKAIGLIVLAVIVLALYLARAAPVRACSRSAVLVLLLAFRAAKWAFWPRSSLPRNRVRHQRIRLYLRLHPGRGHATWWELHRHWGRRACYKRVSQVRSS